MKKINILLSLVAGALMFVGCQKDNLVFDAMVESYNGGNSKAYIDSEGYACWNQGDKVRMNNLSTTVQKNAQVNPPTYFIAVAAEDLTNDRDFTSVYPNSESVTVCDHGMVTMKLPEEQTYKMSDFVQVVEAPMVAYATSTNDVLKFRNVGNLMAITVPYNATIGDMNVYEIAVTSSNSPLWGTITIDAKTNVEEPAIKSISKGGKTVRLLIDGTDGEITSATRDGGKTFYIAIPEIENSRFMINVYYTAMKNGAKNSVRFESNLIPATEMSVVRNAILPITMNYTKGVEFTGVDVLRGEGTESNPRQIRTVNDMLLLASLSEFPATNNFYSQVKDITLPADFAGIGTTEKPFVGKYFGGNHTINNTSAKGVFNVIGANSTVKEVIVNNTINTDGANTLGGLVNVIKGDNVMINLCTVKGSINVTNATTAYAVGGICGKNESAGLKVENCTNEMDITCAGKLSIAGGIMGENTGNGIFIKLGTNKGNITSGIVGGILGQSSNVTTINRCINVRESLLNSNEENGTYMGGLLGNNVNSVNFYNSVNHGKLKPAAQYVGGLVGHNSVGGKVFANNNYADGTFDERIVGFESTQGGLIGKNGATATFKNTYVGFRSNLNMDIRWIVGEGKVSCTYVYRPIDGGLVWDNSSEKKMSGVIQYDRDDQNALVGLLNPNVPKGWAKWKLINGRAALEIETK